MALQIRRGSNADRTANSFTPVQGELVYTTDTKDLWVGDGVTVGGTQIAPVKSVNGLTGTVALTTDNITQGVTNAYYSTNQAKIDAAAALVAGNAGNTGITFSFNSSTKVITASVASAASIANVQADANPALGGNLSLNNKNINGTGNISITGTLSVTGLGADLVLNSKNITGTGSITINSSSVYPISTGAITAGVQATLPWIAINASRGTPASPTTTLANDILSGYQVRGYTGSQYVFGGGFYASWDSTAVLSDAQPASNLTFIAGGGGSSVKYLNFTYAGVLSAPIFQATSYTTTNMNAIPNPTAGMIIFNSTANHFYGYNGTSWVAFTGP